MTTPVISVEDLSKAYRMGLKEEIPDTVAEAVWGWLKAPVRNWRRLRRLNTFGAEVMGQRSEQETDANGNPHANGSGLLTLDSPPADGSGHANGSPTSDLRPLTSDADIIWALRDVSFEVNEGEVVGIIGRNGAGKSTLLKILSRITEPTRGRAVIRGRVSSLLEVGTGFHPELTGRENIYMNGTILGMTKREIDRKFDEIVDFSGIEVFLDTAVKRFSSGMQVRLAFSVAAHLEPEVLIIDEVLAVGDAQFQRRCIGKMRDVACGGRTVLFVSHNMAAVRSLCTRAALIDNGVLAEAGGVAEIVDAYLQRTYADNRYTHLVSHENDLSPSDVVAITAIVGKAVDPPGGPPMTGLAAEIVTEYTLNDALQVRQLFIALGIKDGAGAPLFCCSTASKGCNFTHAPRQGRIVCHLDGLPLIPGEYLVEVKICVHTSCKSYAFGTSRFHVVDSGESGQYAYASREWGCVVVPHKWELRPIQTASS